MRARRRPADEATGTRRPAIPVNGGSLVNQWLSAALRLDERETPFPWQEELLDRFVSGNVPAALDIPTGLGKTAVMAIWLVARANGAKLPRRLVYVVDRRAVVDQATEVAVGLRDLVDRDCDLKQRLGINGKRSLPISTLRGQHVDNREWLEDPTAPAIIVDRGHDRFEALVRRVRRVAEDAAVPCRAARS